MTFLSENNTLGVMSKRELYGFLAFEKGYFVLIIQFYFQRFNNIQFQILQSRVDNRAKIEIIFFFIYHNVLHYDNYSIIRTMNVFRNHLMVQKQILL